MEITLLDSWSDLAEIALRGVVMFIVSVSLLRVAGKRTVMTLTAFDLITTVAMGTLIASTVLSVDRPLFEGVVAVATFIGLQWIISFVVSRFDIAQRIVINPPRLLVERGRVLQESLDAERISINQLEQEIREQGKADFATLTAVTLEPSGSFSVIGPETDLSDLENHRRIDLASHPTSAPRAG